MAPEAPEPQTKNKTNPDMDVISHSHLGGLPPELFDKVLFEINAIRDLAQFIPTARFVYHRFRLQRRAVFFRVLQNELGPVLADAMFVYFLTRTPQIRPGMLKSCPLRPTYTTVCCEMAPRVV